MSRHWKLIGWLMLASGMIAGNAPGARADIKYTTETKPTMDTAGTDGNAGDSQTPKMVNAQTVWLREGQERTEMTTQIGPMHMQRIEITLCDKHQRIQVAPDLKLYAVAAANKDNQGSTAGEKAEAATGTEPAGTGQPETGKMINTFAVKDLGEEPVSDIKTHHYLYTVRTQASGCVGNFDHTTKMEVWVSSIRVPHLDCAMDPYRAYMRTPPVRSKCKVTMEEHGDAGLLKNIYSGLVMRMKIYAGDTDKVMMVQEVTSLSQAALDDAPFTIPADYKQVSEQELTKAQTQAMMRGMMQGQKDTPGAGNNGDDQN